MNIRLNITMIHYGSTVFDPKRFRKIKNGYTDKPDGGLWASPADTPFGWRDWCEEEEFGYCDIHNSMLLSFKEGTRVLCIDSINDLKDLPIRKVDIGRARFTLDFEALTTMYDAIYLTLQGMYETSRARPVSLYAWDCESILILNKDCVNQIK